MEQDQAEMQRHAAFRRERMLASGLLREPEPAQPEPRRAIARPLLAVHPAAPAIAAAAAPPPPALARFALAAALTPAG